MNCNPASLSESLVEAQAVMAMLADRASETARSIDDLAELSVLTTTTAKIEELLSAACEYEELLLRQLRRTRARIA